MALSGSVNSTSYSGRYYTLAWTATQNIASNTSTISWTLSCSGGKVNMYAERTLKVVINGKAVVDKTSRVERYKGTIASGTTTIAHNTDGTKSFSVSISAAVYTSAVNCTGSKNFTLNQIPRGASITSADAFTDESSPVLTYSNPAGSIVNSLQACIASTDGGTIYVPYRDISISGTSYTFDFTEEERENLRKLIPNAKSLETKFYIKTVIGTNTFYSSLQKTFSIANAEPEVSIDAYAADTLTQNLFGKHSLIMGVTDVAYVVSATAKKHATIKSYSVVNGTETKTTATGTFTDIKDRNFTVTVTDSRGFTKKSNIMFGTYVEYVYPTATLSYSNVSVEGRVDLDMRGNCYGGNFGANPNAIILQYRYKASDGSWSGWKTHTDISISGNTYSSSYTLSGLDYRKTYIIEYKIVDSISGATSNQIEINFVPLFDWGANDFQFNVNTFWANGNIGVRGITTDGTPIQSLIPCNANNNMTIGYGLYDLGIGNTNIYGNRLNLISNETVSLNNGAIYGEHVLFNNPDGAAAAVTLSQSAADFTYLEIYFEDNNLDGAGYTKIYNPDGKEVDLSVIEATPSNMTYIRRTSYSISGKTITPLNTGYLNFGASTGTSTTVATGTNYLRITRVVGIK